MTTTTEAASAPLPDWFTTAELCAWLNLPAPTFYNLRHRGDGPRGVRVGGQLRFRRSDVEAWLESNSDAA